MIMLPWVERPIEVATLLNPAFCAILLHDAVEAYAKEQNEGMAFPLVFIVLPLVLHKDTRNVLPPNHGRLVDLYQWVADHPLYLQNFVKRTRYLVPYSREGLIFSIKHGFIKVANAIGQEGYLSSTNKPFIQKPSWSKQSESAMCREKAQMLGKWFAKAGSPINVFKIFGIRP